MTARSSPLSSRLSSPLLTAAMEEWHDGGRVEIRCSGCGYGAVVACLPVRCPMCGGATWHEQRGGFGGRL